MICVCGSYGPSQGHDIFTNNMARLSAIQSSLAAL